jgi:hypothetical protein
LEKKGLLRAALAKEAELARHVPGAEQVTEPTVLDPRIRGLVKLTEVRGKAGNEGGDGEGGRRGAVEYDVKAASRATACIRAQAAAHHDPFSWPFFCIAM